MRIILLNYGKTVYVDQFTIPGKIGGGKGGAGGYADNVLYIPLTVVRCNIIPPNKFTTKGLSLD